MYLTSNIENFYPKIMDLVFCGLNYILLNRFRLSGLLIIILNLKEKFP